MTYNRVLISNIFGNKDNRATDNIIVNDEVEYRRLAPIRNRNNGGICEIVGLSNFQVKPYFDYDAKFDNIDDFDEKIIQEIISDIKKVVDVEVYYSGRKPRQDDDTKGKWKASYRLYVAAKITYTNIPILFKDLFDKYPPPQLDRSVYSPNRLLFSPLSDRKRNTDVPALMPISGGIFDCCATYIKEDYKNLDELVSTEVEAPKNNTIVPKTALVIEDGNEEYKNIQLDELIYNLKPERADDRDSWINGMWAIMNCCDIKGIKAKGTYDLCDKFSAKCETAYDEDGVYTWFHANYDKRRQSGFRFKFLLDWLKEDSPDYYRGLFAPSKKILSYLKQKQLFEIDHTKILYPVMYAYRPTDKNKKLELMCPKLLKETYAHLRCIIKKQTPKGVEFDQEVSFINKWIEDPNIKMYDYMEILPPPLKVPADTYNTWIPISIFDVQYDRENTTFNEEILTRFKEYGIGLLGEEVFKYMIAYFANRLQNPAERNGVCIILYGVEGDGKNMFFDIFKNIFGLKYFHELEKASDLFSSHSFWEVGRLFICVNEADPKDTKGNAEVLKARITTETINANPKGVNMFTSKNYCDYVMTTNNDDAVRIDNASRRYLICQSSAKFRGDAVYFGNLRNDIVKNDAALRVIADYLMNFNVSEVIPTGNFQKHIPHTDIMDEVIEFNMDYVERFLREYTKLRFRIKDDKIKTDDIFISWRAWCERCNITSKMDKPTFSRRLNKLIREKNWDFIKKDTDHHSRGYIMYKDRYRVFIGIEFNEDRDEDEDE